MNKNKLVACALAGMLSSSLAFADAKLAGQFQLVSASDLETGSEVVFDVIVSNTGSDNLNSMAFFAVDHNLTFNMSQALFQIENLAAGAQQSMRVTINTPTPAFHFDSSLVLSLSSEGRDDAGQSLNIPVVLEGGAQ